VHPKGANSIAMSEFGCRKALIRPFLSSSAGMGLRKSSRLVGALLLSVMFCLSLHGAVLSQEP